MDDEISPAVRVQVRLDSARSALWSALNACPGTDPEYREIAGLLGEALVRLEDALAAVRKKTGV